MLNNNLQLQGKFQFFVYNNRDELKYSTEKVDNFITNSGLSYPFYFLFADCFRYLSVGTGGSGNNVNTENEINSFGITGLCSGINLSGYSYVGGGGSNQYTNCADSTESRYIGSACGYRVNNSGITLSRGWRVPNDTSLFFTKTTALKEYMLTPGRPPIAAFTDTSWVTPVSLCSCNELGYPDGLSTPVVGPESASLNDYYQSVFPICNATKAFTRVVKDVTVALDEYLIVHYALDINYNTGVKPFNLSITRQSPVDNITAYTDPLNWNGLASGISSLVHPGISLIKGSADSFTSVAYINLRSPGVPQVGESFIPPLGNPMEPSLSYLNRVGYISSDNTQFIVNDLSGGYMPTGSYFPYNSSGRAFPSGVLAFHKNWIQETSSENPSALGNFLLLNDGTYGHFRNIRTTKIGTNDTASFPGASFPKQSNYREQATDPAIGFTQAYLANTQISIKQNVYTASDRSRSVVLSSQWVDPQVDEVIFPVRSVVYAYKYTAPSSSVSTYYPFYDTLFAPKTGGYEPPIQTGDFTFSDPSGRVNSLLSNDSGHYFMDNSNILQLGFKLSWSSPCNPAEVVGC